MSNTRLSDLLLTLEQKENEISSFRLAVWDELERDQPQIASEILSLLSTREAAALWVTSSRLGSLPSPARLIVEGEVENVLTRLLKTAHGFSA